MPLQVGIVGLPNVGKSTLFNTLLDRQIAQAENYPFTTIKPNVGVVKVPDENLQELATIIKEDRKQETEDRSSKTEDGKVEVVPTAIEFVDIAGLVEGAHQGEGLGNQFLAQIREVDAIIHLLRGFNDPRVAHIHGEIDPKFDQEIINLELKEAGLADKPQLTVLNTASDNSAPAQPLTKNSSWLEVDARTGAGVDKLIQETYRLLNLITFYTIKDDHSEVRAWPLKKGTPAPQAAGKIHTDFQKHFVKAEIINLQDLKTAGGWKKAKEQGKIRIEGTGYCINDKDVIYFKVNL